MAGENHYAREQTLGEPVITLWNGSSPYGASSVTLTWNGSITLKFHCSLRSEDAYFVLNSNGQICTYLRQVRQSPPVLSLSAQSVTSDSKIYCEKVKMCQFSDINWFFGTKLVQLAVAGKSHNTVVHLQKRVY
jgi:hypothetical protein